MLEEEIEELAKQYIDRCTERAGFVILTENIKKDFIDLFVAGFMKCLELNKEIKWHKIFKDKPYNEYYDLPQGNLPKNENFYFVKLKNGYIKICELKYDPWNKRKYFYDLHGMKQSNVAEWLDYPEADKE